MSRVIRVALGQINPCLGDLRGNIKKIISYTKSAEQAGADIVAFPELAITGYPPEDLLLKQRFIEDNIAALAEVCCNTGDVIAVVGFVDRTEDIYNAAAVIHRGKIVHIYHKIFLPTYSVFDEDRYFKAGNLCPVFKAKDFSFGVNICEDIWYPEGPSYIQALAGAELIININASPFYYGKAEFRKKMLCTRAHDCSAAIAYVNIWGGQDELVFDGASMIVDAYGLTLNEAPRFQDHLLITDVDLDESYKKRLHDPRGRKRNAQNQERPLFIVDLDCKTGKTKHTLQPSKVCPDMVVEEEIYCALVTGTGDYIKKNRFKSVCLGLSGGVDSSLVAKIAVDAIGKDNVLGVFMPSQYTSIESRQDAYALAHNLGINIVEIPIMEIYDAYTGTLQPLFDKLKPDLTEENLQARIRGTLLMALSNKFGYLLLTTGNKSEMSVGYATLYGDMAGGFAVIKDVSKTMVYRICQWINRVEGRFVIPERVLTKAPTAELRENQKDSDSLPPYEELDMLIEAYIEQDRDVSEIGDIKIENIKRVISLIDRSEYKRRQSPPGVKITQRAFGRDRRYPITNGYNRD